VIENWWSNNNDQVTQILVILLLLINWAFAWLLTPVQTSFLNNANASRKDTEGERVDTTTNKNRHHVLTNGIASKNLLGATRNAGSLAQKT